MNKIISKLDNDRINKLLNHNLTLLIFFSIVILLFFSPSLVKGRWPGPFEYINIWKPWNIPSVKNQGNYVLSDQVDGVFPNYQYIRSSLREGTIPFWNSELGFGLPFFHMSFYGHFYPSHALTLLLFPMYQVWFVSGALRMLLVGFFTSKLLKLYNVDLRLALLAGVTFMTSYYYVVWAGAHLSFEMSAMPFFLYATTRLSIETTRWTKLLFFLSLLNLLLSPRPAEIFFILFISSFYILMLMRIRLFTTWHGWTYITLGVAALIVVSGLYYYSAEYLTQTALEGGRRASRGLAHLELDLSAQTFFPELFGNFRNRTRLPEILAAGNFNKSSIYFSIFLLLPIILHYIYLIAYKEYRNNKIIIFWTIVQIWVFALIYNLFDILSISSRLPIFRDNPNYRMQGIFVFASIIIGTYAMNHAIFKIKGDRTIEKMGFVIIFLSSFGIIHIYSKFITQYPDTMLHVFMQLMVLALSGFVFLQTLAQTRNVTRTVFIFGLIGVTLFNNIALAGRYNSDYAAENFFPETDFIHYLQDNLDTDTKIISIGRTVIPHMNLYNDIASVQYHGYMRPEQVALLQGLDSDYRDGFITQAFFDAFDPDETNRILDFLNVKYIVAQTSDLSVMEPFDENEFEIINFPNNLLLIENIVRPYTQQSASETCNDNQIYEYSYHNNTINVQTNLCNDGELVLPVWNYKGWYISKSSDPNIYLGKEMSLIKLTIPKGIQNIQLRFVPKNLLFFILLAILGLSIAMWIIVSGRWSIIHTSAPGQNV